MTVMLASKKSILRKLNENTFKSPTTYCWEWLGSDVKGHGVVQIQNVQYRVHRLSLYIYKDFDLNSELLVLHKVICPNRNCWNPEHLYAGTACDNANDVLEAKKNYNVNKTHCPHGHEYTIDNTEWDFNYSNPRRRWKECRKVYYRKLRNG